MQAVISRPPAPPGLRNFAADFARKAAGLAAALSGGRVRVIRSVAVAA
jgi:hypothetical protein